MSTINFGVTGGEKEHSYSLSCKKPPTFIVDPEEAEEWLTVEDISTVGSGKIKISATTNDTGRDREANIIPIINEETCWDKALSVGQDGSGSAGGVVTAALAPQMSVGGGVNQPFGTYNTTDLDTFDVNMMSASSDIQGMYFSFSAPNAQGTGNIYATYPAVTQATYGTVTVYYASSTLDNKDVSQLPAETVNLSYKITTTSLDACGNSNHVIGKYYYQNCGYVNNTQFSMVGGKPSWLEYIGFGVATSTGTNSGEGDIIVRYGKNTGSTPNTCSFALTYDGYVEVSPVDSAGYTLTQPVPTAGQCTPAPDPSQKPTSCTGADFHHWHHPYVNPYDYYYLDHDITASPQQYSLYTTSKYDISDVMWKDVRVEIYDVLPIIEHRSAGGVHYVNVVAGQTFAETKAAHEATCRYAGSGEYKVNGYSSETLIAVYENGSLVESETDHSKYDGFWFKANDMSHSYDRDLQCRKLTFDVSTNIGAETLERYALIKVFPKIGGTYCKNDTGCEDTGDGCTNTCVKDLVKQAFVNCSDDVEYVRKNAYFNEVILQGYGDVQGIYDGYKTQGAMIYGYFFGPCPNCNPQYMDTVEIFELTEETTYQNTPPDPSTQEPYGTSAKILSRLIKLQLGNGYDGISDDEVYNYTPVEEGENGFIRGVAIIKATCDSSTNHNVGMIRIQTDKWNVTPSTDQWNQRYRLRGYVVYNSKKYTPPTPYAKESWNSYIERLDGTYSRRGKIQQSNVYEHFEMP